MGVACAGDKIENVIKNSDIIKIYVTILLSWNVKKEDVVCISLISVYMGKIDVDGHIFNWNTWSACHVHGRNVT